MAGAGDGGGMGAGEHGAEAWRRPSSSWAGGKMGGREDAGNLKGTNWPLVPVPSTNRDQRPL